MDIELLRTFLEVERTRHFGKAAETLFISQSAVSARIRQLEQVLGIRLFTRHRNNIQLTDEGRGLREYAQTIVQAWQQARREVGQKQLITDALSIGALWGIWETLLRGWVPTLRRALSTTALHIETGTAESLPKRLTDGVLDLAVVFDPPPVPGLEHTRLGSIQLQLLASTPDLTVQEAMTSNYVLVDWGDEFARQIAQLYPDAPTPSLHFNQGAQAWTYLQQVGGAAYLPEPLFCNKNAHRPLYTVADAAVIERDVHAIHRANSERVPQIQDALAKLHTSQPGTA